MLSSRHVGPQGGCVGAWCLVSDAPPVHRMVSRARVSSSGGALYGVDVCLGLVIVVWASVGVFLCGPRVPLVLERFRSSPNPVMS